jgi:hypothetical protein
VEFNEKYFVCLLPSFVLAVENPRLEMAARFEVFLTSFHILGAYHFSVPSLDLGRQESRCFLFPSSSLPTYVIYSTREEMPPRHQPKYKITWWMRFRSKTRYLHSPLDLRRSIVRLRHRYSNPYLTLLKLFIKDLQ